VKTSDHSSRPTISSTVHDNLAIVRVFRADGQRDSAAGGELRCHDCLAWRACVDEIVQNAVCYRFIEGALIVIRGKIKLERLAFDTETVRHVVDIDPGEIWLACDWTKRSEIVRFKVNPIIAPRRRIRESL